MRARCTVLSAAMLSASLVGVGLWLAPVAAGAANHVVIVAGLGGDPRFEDEFVAQATALYEAASAAGVPPENVALLAEDPERDPRIGGKSTKENVLEALATAIGSSSEGDELWVVLIGHGSFRDGRSQINLPGPDLSDLDFAAALAPGVERRIVFVNTTSGSGGFVATLSGPDRIVVTATKSAAQRNETLFGGFFSQAFSDVAADADRDGRVSVIEAFDFAQRGVEEHYETRQLLRTEHALLDDNGDGAGSTDPDPLGGEDGAADGLLASRVLLGGAPRPAVPEGMETDATERDRLARQLEALRRQKGSLSEESYEQELQRLLLEIARIDARIRAAAARESGAVDATPETSAGDGGSEQPAPPAGVAHRQEKR